SVSQKLEEKLVCSICLELFRVAVTLPCGHNFCQQCIGDHWDRQEQEAARAEKGYTCPDCRKSFKRRLELKKNVTLCGVVELARAGEVQAAGAEGREAAQGGQCPRHGRPLELYCEDERRCICCVCTVRQCQRHRRVLFEEERSKKQALLRESLEKAQQESERIEQAMQELEKQTCSIKDSSESLKLVVLKKFGHLEKALKDCQWQTVARIEQEQAAALGQVEENWSHLKNCLDTLSHHREKAQDLLACTNNQTFLEVLPCHGVPHCPSPFLSLAGVTSRHAPLPLRKCSELFPSVFGAALHSWNGAAARGSGKRAGPKAPRGVFGPPSTPLLSLPCPDHRNLTFDAETANKYLQLSSRNQKAKHPRSAGSPRRDHAARFELWQALCTQSYGHGRHYWEVKVSGHSVIVGVTYRDLPRKRQPGHKFNIGLDGGSWGLQVREDCYLAWHKGRSEKIQERLYEYLGVSLDYGNGVLSFYGLGDRTQLIHTFHHIFTEPLYPVFWLCEGRTVTLCQR
ncbi:TRI65 protein, partial [Casuarius casuarius]|nr:TRI65 protein [Casuarius casuarius]